MKPELVQTDNGDELSKARELIAQEIAKQERECAEGVVTFVDSKDCQVTASVTLVCHKCGNRERVPVEAILRIPVEVGVEARRK
jgi:hypothetical protein